MAELELDLEHDSRATTEMSSTVASGEKGNGGEARGRCNRGKDNDLIGVTFSVGLSCTFRRRDWGIRANPG